MRPLIATAAVLAAAGCQALAPTGPASTAPTTPPPSTYPATTAGVDRLVQAAQLMLAARPVDDRRPPAGYRRDLFPHWKDLDGDGCDARDTELAAESTRDGAPVDCHRLAGGRWVSDYDGQVLTDPARVDVDHVVPLAEAWRSGAAGWTTTRRAEYANDPVVLWAVSAASNRAKGDRDPAEWQPTQARCLYAMRWVEVKNRYGLTVDTAERDALGRMLDACTGDTKRPA